MTITAKKRKRSWGGDYISAFGDNFDLNDAARAAFPVAAPTFLLAALN